MNAPAQSSPIRRWHQRRLVRYSAVLLVAAVGAYFVWDVLFMPRDLRRLQGSWKIMRVVQDDHTFRDDVERMVVTGRQLTITDRHGRRESGVLDIVPDRGELLLCKQHEMTIFGMTIRVPGWLERGETYGMRYELDGSKLTLRLRADAEENQERKIELVREED